MGIEDFFGFSKSDFRARIEALARNGNFQEIRRLEIKSIRKGWGAGTGTTLGALAAIPTAGLSLFGSGVGARRLYVHDKKVEIARSVLAKYGIPPYQPSLSDKWVPAIASTFGFGVGMGLDGGVANHLIDSGAQHLGIAGVNPEAHHGVADGVLSHASSAGASAAIMSTMAYRETNTGLNRRAAVPVPQATQNTKVLREFNGRTTRSSTSGYYQEYATKPKAGMHSVLKLFLSLLFAGGFWYAVFIYRDQILSLEMSWVKRLLSHLPAFLLSVLDWVQYVVVAGVSTATYYGSSILSLLTLVLSYSLLCLLCLATMLVDIVSRGFRWLSDLYGQLLVASR